MPIVLLIIAKYSQVLFQSLVCSFRLTITFGMISRSEVELHVECFSKRSEKSRKEFGASVGGYMFRDSVFREHVSYKYGRKVFGGAVDCCRNEDALLGESVNNH